jgi:hypothetical protein
VEVVGKWQGRCGRCEVAVRQGGRQTFCCERWVGERRVGEREKKKDVREDLRQKGAYWDKKLPMEGLGCSGGWGEGRDGEGGSNDHLSSPQETTPSPVVCPHPIVVLVSPGGQC